MYIRMASRRKCKGQLWLWNANAYAYGTLVYNSVFQNCFRKNSQKSSVSIRSGLGAYFGGGITCVIALYL